MNFKQSLDFGLDQSHHINPINVAPKSRFHRNLYASEFQNPSILINKCINVLSENRMNSSLTVNDQFQQYLTQDTTNPDAVIISFVGNKQVGKSFLIDSLLTAENNKICRIMCKNKQKIINSPAISTKTSGNQNRLIYFDCSGDPTDYIFLWNYFLSSIVVYNVEHYDVDKQERFFNNLDFVKNHLNTESGDFSLPQLIVVFRDTDEESVNSKQYKQFILEVEKYEIFQPKITYICMPYPGKSDVATKEIVDVPLIELNPSYVSQVDRLMKTLKNGKPKIIKGNYISTKILSLALQPVAKSINKEQTINTNKVWDEIIENLSIGFYNYYLKSYENELLTQFQNQEPQDKYTLYKKLTNMKRKINKKIEGFKTLEHEPIFSKYKSRLNTVVKQKQNLIKEINQGKSKEANDIHCRRVLGQIDANNAHQILQQYNKSGLTDQKAEVLVQNFVKIIEEKASKIKRNPGKSSNLLAQVEELQQQVAGIRGKVKNVNKVSSPEEAKRTIDEKKQKIKQLHKQQSQLKAQIDKLLNNQKKSPELISLEQQKQRLSQKIQKDKNQEIELRQQRQRQMRELTKKQESQVKKQQENLKALQQRLKQLKSRKPVEKAKQKQGCCNLI